MGMRTFSLDLLHEVKGQAGCPEGLRSPSSRVPFHLLPELLQSFQT